MGWLTVKLPNGQELLLGDEHGCNQYNREQGLPHYDKDGRYVSQAEIDKREKENWR